MGVTAATIRVACDTSTGNQDITTADLGGLTPKAALFIVSYGVTDGTPAAHAVLSYGAATGTSNRWVVGGTNEDAQGTTDTDRFAYADRCIEIMNPGDQTTDGRADFVSFITNGVRINWSDAPASAYLLTVVLFAGTDLSVHANTFTMHATVNNAVDVTDPGFEPDVLILAGGSDLSFGNSLAQWQLSYGFVHNDRASGITQRAVGTKSIGGAATSACISRCTASYGIVHILNSGNVYKGAEFGTFDADGFSCTSRINGGGGSGIGYLALRFGAGPAVDSWLGTHTTPVAPGNDADAGPGFTPQAVLFLGTMMEAIDTAYTHGLAGSFGLGAFDADDEYMVSVCAEDGVGTSNTQSLSDDTAVQLPDDDGAAGLTASFVSFDANGWTLNYSAVEANAKLFFVVAIEEETAAGLSISVLDSVTISETESLSVSTLTIGVSDSVAISESIAASIPGIALTLSVSDTISLAESIGTALTRGLSVSDSISVTEALQAELPNALALAVSDAVGIAESVGTLVVFLIGVSDSPSVAESLAVDLTRSLSVSDTISVAEAVQVTISTANATISDTISLSESIGVAVITAGAIALSVSDAVSLSEAVTAATSTLALSVSDSVSLAEQLQVALATYVGVSDSVSVAESTSLALGTLTLALSDSISLAESLTVQPAAATIGVSDAVGVAESISLALATFVGVSDSPILAESVAVSIGVLSPSVSDAVGVAESLAVALATLTITVSDTASVSESVGISIAAIGLVAVSVSDTISLSEQVQGLIGLAAQVSDSISVAEQVGSALLVEPGVSDSVSLSESLNVALTTLTLAASESIALSESLALTRATSVVTSDAVSVAESVAAYPFYALAVSESVNLLDSPSIAGLLPAPSVSDSVAVSESLTMNAVGLGYSLNVSESIGVAELIMALFFAKLDVALSDASVSTLSTADTSAYPLSTRDRTRT